MKHTRLILSVYSPRNQNLYTDVHCCQSGHLGHKPRIIKFGKKSYLARKRTVKL